MAVHARLLRQLGWGLLALVMIVGRAEADTASGVHWLNTLLQPGGEISTSGDIAIPLQSTAESARLLALHGAAASVAAASRYVLAQEDASTEALSRKLLLAAQAGGDTAALLAELLSNQDSASGGFSAARGEQPSIIDTAFAVEALAIAGQSSSMPAARAIGYLQARQLADGSWQENSEAPALYLTALATQALQLNAGTYPVSASIQKGTHALLAARQGDGLWGEDYLSGLSLLSLVSSLTDITPVTASIAQLQARQQGNGSWQGDAYITAVVLRALTLAEFRTGGGQGGDTGSLSGHVRKAGTQEPVADATIAVAGIPGLTVKTNAAGYFVLGGLRAGNATVVATKAGHSSASAVAKVVAGTMSTVSGLFLEQASDSGTIRLRITNAATGDPLQGVVVSLSGATVLGGQTAAGGELEFPGVVPGAYSFSLSRNGYRAISGGFTLSAGGSVTLNQPLAPNGSDTTGAPALSGMVIDGASSAPLPGAVFTLASGRSAVSDASGRFVVEGVQSGSYAPVLSAGGYQSQQYSIVVPSGASANLGTLKLFRGDGSSAPDRLTLLATVLDSVTGRPIVGAQLSVAAQSLAAVTNGQGQATLAGIANLSFQMQIAAPGYASQAATVTAAAYGASASTFHLSPDSEPAGQTVLQGRVTDAVSGQPIGGALVQVIGAPISASTNASGYYSLSGIQELAFSLRASASRHETRTQGVNLPAKGSYQIDLPLDPSDGNTGFTVLALDAHDAGMGAFETQRFGLQVRYEGSAAQEVLLKGLVLDAGGREVASVSPYAPGTQTPQGLFHFTAEETKTLELGWNPAQLAPGAYTLQLHVVKPGSLSREVPHGRILAQRSVSTQVSGTQAFSGSLSFDPPVAQAGGAAPVQLAALIGNAGNLSLSGQPLTLRIRAPGGGALLHSIQVPLPQLEAGDFAQVEFGGWVPAGSGHLEVAVTADTPGLSGSVQGILYVGDRPQGGFTVTPDVVFPGTQTVQGTVNASGVDARLGVSHPLVQAIREAVGKGSEYVAQNMVVWKNANQCLGCHMVSQPAYGLESLQRRNIIVDAAAARFAANALMSAQNDTRHPGAIMNSNFNTRVTQTALASWALGQMPDRVKTFRTLYRAAQFLDVNRNPPGPSAESWWQGGDDIGWWTGPEPHTMLAIQAFANVLDAAGNIDLAAVKDHRQDDVTPLIFYSAVPQRLRLGPAGALYVLNTHGQLVRIDPFTREQTRIVDMQISACRALAIAPSGDTYAICDNRFFRIAGNGAVQQLSSYVPNEITDIAVAPDGRIFASHLVDNQILLWTGSGFETWTTGGLMNGPAGLAFSADGMLYVASTRDRSILKIAPDKTISKFSDGLIVQPWLLNVSGDGSVYVTGIYAEDEYLTIDSNLEIDPQGRVQRMMSMTGGRMIMTANGLFFVNSANVVGRMVDQALDVSGLPAFRLRVTEGTRYLLGRHNANPQDPNNLLQAVRLMAFSDASRVIADSGLKAAIATAAAEIEATLRSRQNADGGWGLTPVSDSDPLLTALVGFGLDSRNPLPNDGVVLAAIQYLLNAQWPDKSWRSSNGVMTTHMGTTSLVMAYLPRAMDYIGGLNVDLHIDLPPDIQLAQPSIPPSSVASRPDGGSAYSWSLPGLTTQGRNLSFDLTLDAMQVGEARPAALAAYLLSANSFSGERLRVDLPVPDVRATNGLSLLSVTTDKGEYGANETARLQAQVTSAAPVAVSGSLRFSIRSQTDESLVAQLPPVPFAELAPGQPMVVSANWFSGVTAAGGYTVVGELFDEQGHKSGELPAQIVVLASTGGGAEPTASLRVRTDKPIYGTSDQVAIANLVHNLAMNAAIPHARLELEIRAPGGAVVSTLSVPLGSLAAGAVRELPRSHLLEAAVQGGYQVLGRLVDGEGALLAADSTGFQVAENLGQTLVGAESVQHATLYQGDTQSCTSTVSNRGTLPISGLGLRQRLVNLDREAVEQESTLSADLAQGASQAYARSYATQGLTPGHHACVLEAQIGSRWESLAYARFVVVKLPVVVSGSVQAVHKPVIQTDPQICGSVVHNNGPRALAGLPVRRSVTSTATGARVLETQDAINLPASGQRALPQSFDTTGQEPGAYACLLEAQVEGQWKTLASDTFEIVPIPVRVSGSVVASLKPVPQGGTQTCRDSLRNDGPHPLSGLPIRQRIVRTAPEQILAESTSTQSLPGNGQQTLTRVFSIDDRFELGTHACVLEAQVDGQWRSLASDAFVVEPPPLRLSGNLATGDKGRLLVLMDGPANGSSGSPLCESGLVDVLLEASFDPPLSPDAVVEIRLLDRFGLLVDVESTSLLTFNGEINLRGGRGGIDLVIPSFSAGGLVIGLTGEAGQKLLDGTYRLTAKVASATRTLNLDSGLISLGCNTVRAVGDTLGQVFRILGINHSLHAGEGIGDGRDRLSATAQRQFLEDLLRGQGWSHKVVTAKADFTREMRSGAYQNYALLSEYVVLDEQTQKELREAVNRGEGLLAAGRHDVRRRILEPPLGVRYSGIHLHPVGVGMLPGSALGNGQAVFGSGNDVQRIRLDGAARHGKLISGVLTAHDGAITVNAYGEGKAALGSFDLLGEASLAGPGLFQDLLGQSLVHINPPQDHPQPGRTVPVRLRVNNDGNAAAVIAKVSVSNGGYVLDALSGSIAAGKLEWSFPMAAGAEADNTLWVRLPQGGLPATVTARLTAASGTQTVEAGVLTLEFAPALRPSLDDALAALTAYAATTPNPGLIGNLLGLLFDTRHPSKKALEHLRAARQALDQGDAVKALAKLVLTTDELIHDGSAQAAPIRQQVDEAIFETGQLQ